MKNENSTAKNPKSEQSKIRILIVEDEIITAKNLENHLVKLGYAVPAVVGSGEKALKKIEEGKPDLVLMDIVLKGEMDGIEAAEIIRTQYDIPIIYTTAYADPKVLSRAKITEPFGYLLKPYQMRELNVSIEIALFKYRVEKERKQAEEERKKLVSELQNALGKVKLLSGMIPICANCKNIRDDEGYWKQIESYIEKHSEALFSHGICPDCTKKLYPELYGE